MPSSIQQWITHVKDKPIPVLSHTVETLGRICGNDETPLEKIVLTVERDPGLTCQLLRHCNNTQPGRLQREIVSVQQAIMLVGTTQLNELARRLPTLEKSLDTSARYQALRTFCRAYHAGLQAVEWARLRRDMTPDEVFAATQLHFLGEMVLAIHAPQQLLETFKLRRERNISSEEAQYLTLGFTFDELSLAIAGAWQLPALVKDALQAENANHPRGFGIMMAVQLARAAAIDWYSDKMNSIYKHVGELLNQKEEYLCHRAHKLAVAVAHQTAFFGVLQSAALLIQSNETHSQAKFTQSVSQDYHADICLTPQLAVLQERLQQLREALEANKEPVEIIQICLSALHDGVGLNRVVYATYDEENHKLALQAVVGANNDPIFNRFSIRLDSPHLFHALMQKTQAICITDENRDKFWSMVPAEFQKLIGTNSFAAMSIFSRQKPLGLVYADRHTSSCQIDPASYNYFKKICQTLSQALGKQAA